MSLPSDHIKSLPTTSGSTLALSEAQWGAIDYILGGDQTFLVADTGEGKTTICLHAIKRYIRAGTIKQCIVAAPANVVDHWPRDAMKWRMGLHVEAIEGTPAQRKALVNTNPDVLVISLNNLDWLLAQKPAATMLIVDELTTACGKQTRALRNKKWVEQIVIRVGMTATPVSESFEKMFAMTRVIDGGKRLGRNKENFMSKYFTCDYSGRVYTLIEGSAKIILDKIDDILYTVISTKHKTLPPVNEVFTCFNMSDTAIEAYGAMKKDLLIELEDNEALAPNQAVASGKLRQIASGFVIDTLGNVHDFDNCRAKMVMAWVANLQGKKGIILHENNHQRKQLRKVLAGINAGYVYGGMGVGKNTILDEFKFGNLHILVAQQKTISHGTDGLQNVCSDALFMQPVWSRDTKIQIIGRLHRTGQKNTINFTTLMARGSLDANVEDRQGTKAENKEKFLKHLRQ